VAKLHVEVAGDDNGTRCAVLSKELPAQLLHPVKQSCTPASTPRLLVRAATRQVDTNEDDWGEALLVQFHGDTTAGVGRQDARVRAW
jgi:hypothetical protein